MEIIVIFSDKRCIRFKKHLKCKENMFRFFVNNLSTVGGMGFYHIKDQETWDSIFVSPPMAFEKIPTEIIGEP